MPSVPLVLRPGVDTEKSPLLNEAGFSASQLIRFFQGKAQKCGGWQRITSTPLIGTCRGLFAWSDLTGVGYIAAGTEQRLEVWNEDTIYDITPIYATDNLGYPPPFSTYSGQTTIIVHDATTPPAVGDWINITSDVAVGGIVLQGLYQVQTSIDGSHYTITAASAATSHVIGGGVTSEFHTYSGQSTVVVTLANHGFTATTSIYNVYVSTTIAGITLYGPYVVQAVLDANTFTITQAISANATAIAYENGGYVKIQYLLQTGNALAEPAMGWGEGDYGLGPWGVGASSGAYTPLRQWTMGQFGKILIACPINSGIYYWNPSNGFLNNQAAVLSGAPSIATGIFVAMAQQQIIAYGITDPNTSLQDPMLIGWCDVGNFNVWTATASNQAGTFRLSRGSRIVGGLQGPQYAMLWTDLGVWLQQYIGFPLVYGFNEIAQGCGLISMRSVGVLGEVVYWCSLNQFYQFGGASVAPLPCTVWDFFFQNANFSEQDAFLLAPNSHFNEFFYFFLNLSGSVQYIKYNQVDRVWDYGSLTRTAWFDQNDVLANNPIGVDGNALIQQHESSNDADGSPMTASITTGFFKLAQGLVIIFLERMIPDFVATAGASIQITVNMVDYPDDTPLFSQTFTWVAGTTEYLIVRGRGRFAQITITSSGLGSFWRLGEFLWVGTGSGRRP